ncbi:hypothetical protein BKA70DRAFT_1227820 [Coprinopsis sp. MPI-PUGE-AT-0042]|nr:hypothetical protein BKA70DRAFT_1227820 [Coprinopsis sp. MPI-PUGE-AT-0042]
MAVDNRSDISTTESSLDGAPLLPDSPSASTSSSDNYIAPPAHDTIVSQGEMYEGTSEVEIVADGPKNKDKGKGRAQDGKENVWGPFGGTADVLKWMKTMPRHEMSLIVKAYILETSTLAPKDRAEAEKWQEREFSNAATDGVAEDGKGQRAKENRDKYETSKKDNKETTPAEAANPGFTIFSHLDNKLRDMLAAQGGWERWLSVLAQHYERNVELAAMMDEELHTLTTAKEYRDRDIDMVRALNHGKASTTTHFVRMRRLDPPYGQSTPPPSWLVDRAASWPINRGNGARQLPHHSRISLPGSSLTPHGPGYRDSCLLWTINCGPVVINGIVV